MLDLIWIIPNLNEKVYIIKSNLLKCFNYNKKKGYKSKIILSDGGSSVKSLVTIKKFIKKLNNENISTKLMLCLPAMQPNKDLGILNIVESYKSKYVIILDADLLSINEKCLEKLVNPLINKKACIILPNIVNRRNSGRINKLIINPLMRLFSPEVAKATDFPLSGILGVDYSRLKKVVTSPDFFWDWGGEIQIITRIFKYNNNSLQTFDHHREDAKRRKLLSKMKDARQLTRTILYEASKKEKLDRIIIEKKLKLSWLNNKFLVESFLDWQKENNFKIISDTKNLSNAFNNFLKNCSKNPRWFFDYLDEIYDKTRAYEILVLKSIVVDTTLRVLFDMKLQYKIKEVEPKIIEKINLETISIFADVIFAVYICLWINHTKKQKKDFHYFLKLLSFEDTEFIDADNLNYFRNQELTSIDINDIKTNQLLKIIKIYNERENILQKNKLLIKTICKK